ncbi:S8 family serine peptidase [Micrococcus sp. IITD107]|uniref:S8 family serine peptidase n=1 Tax=Micrococcus sp. IITD107 TaxID=3342790 RepID=UPI0035B841EA
MSSHLEGRRRGRALVAALTLSLLAAPGLGVTAVAAPTEPSTPSPALSTDTVTEPEDLWRGQQFWLEEYGFTTAWERSRGEGVTVAVIDTGIDGTHPDLTGQVVGGTDVSGLGSSSGDQPIGEGSEHGTLVASVLAGHGHDPGGEPGPGDAGILGVAPEAQLLSISVHLGDDRPGVPPAEEQIPQAVRWAVDQGADIINMSLVSTRTDWPESWDEAFLYAEQNDVLVVAAAGNRASGTHTAGAPATIPGVLTVAGLDERGQASWDASTQGISIGVAAPADPLVGALPGGGHGIWSGTSGAAPLVAGLAALIRSADPQMPAHQVMHRIRATARDAGAPGEDPVYGHGIIDAAAAVTAEIPAVERAPQDSLAEWIRVNRRASVGEPSPGTTPAGPVAPGRPVVTAAPQGQPTALPPAAEPADPAPGLAPALLLGTLLAAAASVTAGVVVYRRSRRDTA